MYLQNNYFSPSFILSRQKVCWGQVCAVCSKSRNVHVFSEIKLRSGSAIDCKKNFSNNRPLATAKQPPLL